MIFEISIKKLTRKSKTLYIQERTENCSKFDFFYWDFFLLSYQKAILFNNKTISVENDVSN